jgi:hypothetical protein
VTDKETARLLVQEGNGTREYTPKRASATTVFSRGDKVRLSFESPTPGYLYVIDRELYADGRRGEPWQVFPTMTARGGNNRVEAGSVVDVPSQSDRVPYFDLKSDDKTWTGELLTVILSPEPLSNFDVLDKASPISSALVEAMEISYLKSVDEYEQEGTVGASYTKVEKDAAATISRQLTQNDPYPQSMFKVKTRSKEPMMIGFRLLVK